MPRVNSERDRILRAAGGFGPPDDERDPHTRHNANGSFNLGPEDWARLKRAKGAALQ